MYLVMFSRQADKDKKLLKAAGLESKAKNLLDMLMINPFQTPPRYEKLLGDMQGNFSRRINLQHRLVYDVIDNTEGILSPEGKSYNGIVRVKRMWTHYE